MCWDITSVPVKFKGQESNHFLPVCDAIYVFVNCSNEKSKVHRKHIVKDIVPRWFNAGIAEIQGCSRKKANASY